MPWRLTAREGRRRIQANMAEFGIDIAKVKDFLRDKERGRREKLDLRLSRARRDSEAILRRIIEEINPRRIYQWGSLVHPERFSEISDIDLALEGLEGPQQYFDALGIAMEKSDFRVDIVEMDKLDAETAHEIRSRGKLVYERGD